MQPGDGHWSTPGMHQVAGPFAALGRMEHSATHSAVLNQLVGYTALGAP